MVLKTADYLQEGERREIRSNQMCTNDIQLQFLNTIKNRGAQLSIFLYSVPVCWNGSGHWAQSGCAGTSPGTSSGQDVTRRRLPRLCHEKSCGLVPMLLACTLLIEYGPRTALGWVWTWFQQLLPVRCFANPPPVGVAPHPSWARKEE